jgi:hypothetical protein
LAGVGAGWASLERLVDSVVAGDAADGTGGRSAFAWREAHPAMRTSTKKHMKLGRKDRG